MSEPRACDLIIHDATILDLESDAGVLDDHAVAVTGNRIVAVGSNEKIRSEWTATRSIDATGMVVSPGFVDAHVHLSAYLGASRPYRPATEPGLFSGASRIVEIGETMTQLMSIPVPDSLMATVARPAFIAMIRSGITSVVAAGSSAHNGLIAAANDIGIRAAIGPSLSDTALGANGVLSQRSNPAELIEQARAFLDEHQQPGPCVTAMISAADTISCSDELLRQIAELSREYRTPTHIHSHVSPASNRAHLDAYGRSETDRLLDAGMLDEHCTLMHVGAIDDADLDTFAATGVMVNHNPLGNAMLGFGTARHQVLRRLLDSHAPVVMGSDYSPSMCATPFDTHSDSEHTPTTPEPPEVVSDPPNSSTQPAGRERYGAGPDQAALS